MGREGATALREAQEHFGLDAAALDARRAPPVRALVTAPGGARTRPTPRAEPSAPPYLAAFLRAADEAQVALTLAAEQSFNNLEVQVSALRTSVTVAGPWGSQGRKLRKA